MTRRRVTEAFEPELSAMRQLRLEEVSALEARLQALRREVATLDALLGEETASASGGCPVISQRDRIREAFASAGEDGLTLDDLAARLPDRQRSWLRVELHKLVARGDGVRREGERFVWTGAMTRRWARRTIVG
jgi:hypothetical protein